MSVVFVLAALSLRNHGIVEVVNTPRKEKKKKVKSFSPPTVYVYVNKQVTGLTSPDVVFTQRSL